MHCELTRFHSIRSPRLDLGNLIGPGELLHVIARVRACVSRDESINTRIYIRRVTRVFSPESDVWGLVAKYTSRQLAHSCYLA